MEPGTNLGQYRVGEKLGAGGMGEVYRATDPKLNREVAIKILPDQFARNSDRMARFEREAQLLASLNHPNIVSVFDLGEQDGSPFIVMEYVPGSTLRSHLKVGGMELKSLLRLALPSAEALARAHRAGVIHRDIKPENILVSEDGYPKVADFGVAKLRQNLESATTVDQVNSTEPGKVVGTFAYMSPDQLEGGEVGPRSDVFSFGVVLYEMATGISPFKRGTPASTSAAILRDTPDPVRKLSRAFPADLDRIIEKALEKDPDFRYQSMEDLASDLKRLRRDLESGRLQEAFDAGLSGRGFDWAKAAMITIGGAVAAALAVWAVMSFTSETPLPVSARLIQLTSLPGLEDSPSWSPDGRSLAYVSDEAGDLNIYVQQIGGGRAIRLSESDADDAAPAWSPDGSRIAFVSARAHADKRFSTMLGMGAVQNFFAGGNGDVWVMPALGGSARRVAENAYSPAWSPDGKRLVYQAMREGRWTLRVIEPDGGEGEQPLDLGKADLSAIAHPAWSPDGQWIAFTGGVNLDIGVFILSSAGGDAVRVTSPDATALMPGWSPDGRWLYFSSNRAGPLNLWKATFRNGALGQPVQVTTGGGEDLRARISPDGNRLAYSSLGNSSDLWEFDLKSEQAVRLTSETTLENNAQPSPDGKWLAFSSNRVGGFHLWLLNRLTGSLTQVTTAPQTGIAIRSQWSRDGEALYYSNNDDPIWEYDVSTGSTRERVDGLIANFCLTPDDGTMVFALESPERIVRFDLTSGEERTLTEIPGGNAADPRCSPDGKWVAFHVQESNQRKLWKVPLEGGEPRQLTFGEGDDSHPTWSADGRWIYYVRGHRDLFAVSPEGGEPRRVTRYDSFSRVLDYPVATSDGKKLIFTRNDKQGDILVLELPNH